MNKLLLVALLLVGCGEKGKVEQYEKDWSDAKPLEVERYLDKSQLYDVKVSTFIMDDYKIIVYHSSYGGRLVAIPLKQKSND
tara:strand:+ start:62 stop:307 length:246 start_codon:yes stop_codon:yes gene_type:complete